MQDKIITVWFSCGAASAVSAKKTLEAYGEKNTIHIFNNPIKEEHPDNRRFLKDCEKWLGHPITILTHPKYPNQSARDVWEDRRYMAGPDGAPCTMILKQEVRRRWEMINHYDYRVLGFTADAREKKRWRDFNDNNGGNTLPVLIELGITKGDCFRIIQDAGIELPEIYKLGFPNANCIGCVKASSATYWNHVRKTFPDVFEDRRQMADELGSNLVWYKGKRRSLSELPPDAKGRPMKDMNVECGVVCLPSEGARK